MDEQARWQVDGNSSVLYQRLLVPTLARLFGALEPTERERVLRSVGEDVAAALTPYVDPEGLAFPQEAHIVIANAGPHFSDRA